MAFKFYFPSYVAPTTWIQLPSPQPGFVPGAPVKFDNSFLTDGGTRYVYAKGITRHIYRADFVLTSQAQLDSLVYFFNDLADGMVNTFDVVLPDLSVVTGCRFTHSSLADRITQQKTGKIYRASIEIEA